MNKTALKNFATKARKELIKKVEAKALKIGITEESMEKAEIESSDVIYIDGKQLSILEKKQRNKLIYRIQDIGFKRVMEEVAYTWFNRFTALRFMEVNNYLPTKVRVLSSEDPNNPEPDIIKEALSVDLNIDKERVYELKVNNKTDELYKYLIIQQCNSLYKYLPFMFETIEDYKEILFPDGLLSKDSFLREMTDITNIPELDWKEQVEIIGWLYQYYIADEKDRVIKAKNKYKTEEIPFATQLFTPDWIVRYMVQNSLGRYWIESHPEDRDLLKNWEFYLENPNPEPDFEEKLAPYINKELKVEDIKCFDPAMGSGHILVYMFDVLFEIYSKCGYLEKDIPRLIIENNLYGLDIDDRAYQLACFSVVMRALQYNSRFFRSIEDKSITLNLASIQETNLFNEQDVAYIAGESRGSNYEQTKAFIDQFKNAKTFGSLIKVVKYDNKFLDLRMDQIQRNPIHDIFHEESRRKTIELLPKLLRQNQIMNIEYDILTTNPPYMSSKYMNENLSMYLKKHYPDSMADTFAAFMELTNYLKPHGYLAMINQHSWMFLSSFEKLREKIINQTSLCSMLHLGSKAFEEIGGEIVQTTAFVLKNYKFENYLGTYIKLIDYQNFKEKELRTLEAMDSQYVNYKYIINMRGFRKIPCCPIAYWITPKILEIFEYIEKLGEIAEPRQGMATSDNNRFLRLWSEVDINKIGFNFDSSKKAVQSKLKWFPYNKGGEFRKWYGNNEFIVNWENDGEEIKEYAAELYKNYTRTIKNISYYFRRGITYTFISSSKFGVRYSPIGFIFDVAGSTIFPEEEDIFFITAFLCSCLAHEFLKIQNPTLNFQVGNIKNLPIKMAAEGSDIKLRINYLAEQNIAISKLDWDFYETSWGFQNHPLLNYKESTIFNAFDQWSIFTNHQFYQLKTNEEELNNIFIDIYDLQDELGIDVAERDVTVKKADRKREINSFISYAVGCMFGRYSLDEEGLIYAGGKFEQEKYQKFIADKDNILPLVAGTYFEDDIVLRIIEFVKITFGEETLIENLDYVAETLGKRSDETATETIRRYFLNDFFKDHKQTYKNRPIYWLFTSGKQKAFNCLIYMHRYDKTTLSRIRTDYLHELQIRLDAGKKELVDLIEGDSSTKEKSDAKKSLKSLELKIDELKAYDEVLHHMADMQIEIDLDDGVVANYAKFNGLLAKLE